MQVPHVGDRVLDHQQEILQEPYANNSATVLTFCRGPVDYVIVNLANQNVNLKIT